MSKTAVITLSANDIGTLLLGGEINWPFALSDSRDLQGVSVRFNACDNSNVRVTNDD